MTSDSIAALSGALIGAYSESTPATELIDSLENIEHIAHLTQKIDRLSQQRDTILDEQDTFTGSNK